MDLEKLELFLSELIDQGKLTEDEEAEAIMDYIYVKKIRRSGISGTDKTDRIKEHYLI